MFIPKNINVGIFQHAARIIFHIYLMLHDLCSYKIPQDPSTWSDNMFHKFLHWTGCDRPSVQTPLCYQSSIQQTWDAAHGDARCSLSTLQELAECMTYGSWKIKQVGGGGVVMCYYYHYHHHSCWLIKPP